MHNRRSNKNIKTGRIDSRISREFSAGVDPQEFVALRQLAEPLIKIYERVLTKELNDAIIRDEDKDLTDSPNYGITLADSMGYRRGLRHAIKLLTMKENNEY